MPLSARNSCLARVWHSCDVLLLFFLCVFCPLEIGCGGGVCVVSAGALVFFFSLNLCKIREPRDVTSIWPPSIRLCLRSAITDIGSGPDGTNAVFRCTTFVLKNLCKFLFCFVSLVMRSCRLHARICVHNVLVFAEFMVPADIATSSSSHARGVDVCVSGRRFVVRSHVSFEVRVSVVRRGAHAVVRGVRLVSLEHLHDVGRRHDCRVHY